MELVYYPLTHNQKNFWFIEKMYPNTPYLNICLTVKFKTEKDYSIINEAVNVMLKKNDSLHLRFIELKGEVKQYISEYSEYKVDFIDFTKEHSISSKEWLDIQAKKTFDLLNDKLFYFGLIKFETGQYGLIIKLHHLITDGWTMFLLANQVVEYYKCLKNGSNVNLEKRGSYIEYISEQEKYLETEEFYKNKKYWEETFEDFSECTSLKPRPSHSESLDADRVEIVLSKELSSEIYSFCEKHKTSVFKLFLSILYVYIYRVTSKESIVVGSSLHNRFNPEFKDIIGALVSTVPFKANLSDKMDFITLLKNSGTQLKEIIAHQSYPYDSMIQDLRKKNPKMEHINLFDIMLIYQYAVYDEEVAGVDWTFVGSDINPMSLNVTDWGSCEEITLEFDYQISVFSRDEAKRIAENIVSILKYVLKHPFANLNDIDFLSENEKKQLLMEFNNTSLDYQREKTIPELLEHQVNKNPDKTALVFKGEKLTYGQLNERSNCVAEFLREKGVGPDSIVGVMVNRSFEMIIAIMGVLKAGGAYMPIDPVYPQDRVVYMLEDSNTKVLLTEKYLLEKVEFNGEVVCIDDNKFQEGVGTNPERIINEKNLAYVIYTSGSTGKPKGVMIEHRTVNNFIAGMCEKIDFSSDKTILALTTISFDIFVLETLLPLSRGMKIVIADEKDQITPNLLSSVILENRVDMLQMTPSRMQLLMSDANSVKCLQNIKEIIIGGEPFPQNLYERIRKESSARIINVYGPTETTVWSTLKELVNDQVINIGKPIANTKIYILDKNNKMQPIGIPGELCIGGEGLARGYYNRPELTKEKFVKNPFAHGEKMYRTGDLASWLPNGEIEFLGRTDFQVKIRGYRIELGEIEQCMLKYEGIRESVVVAKENQTGDKYLAGYYVSEEEIPVSKLRAQLIKDLPDYMVPQAFVRLDSLPLTPNGKLNRKALPEPDYSRHAMEVQYIAPETKCQKVLEEIWRDILKREMVGINDNFFELGGNSILLTVMQSNIENFYPGKVSVADIFANPTISRLSRFIESSAEESYKEVNLDGIIFPSRYYININEENEDTVLKYRISDDDFEDIMKVEKFLNTDKYTFLLSIYMYSLYQELEENLIKVHAYNEQMERVMPLSMDFSEISDFSDIMDQIQKGCRSPNENIYSIDLVGRLKSQKDEKTIIPFFTANTRLPQALASVYGMVFKVEIGSDQIIITCEYNSTLIKMSEVQRFLALYLKALKVITNTIKERV